MTQFSPLLLQPQIAVGPRHVHLSVPDQMKRVRSNATKMQRNRDRRTGSFSLFAAYIPHAERKVNVAVCRPCVWQNKPQKLHNRLVGCRKGSATSPENRSSYQETAANGRILQVEALVRTEMISS